MSDTVTLPRKHIDYAIHALEHFNKNAPDPLTSEIIHHLRTALSAPTSENYDALRATADADYAHIERLGALLRATAVALLGPEPALTSWSWHDLPERVAALRAERDGLRAERDGLLKLLNKFEYSSDGFVKRHPSEEEVIAAIDAARNKT